MGIVDIIGCFSSVGKCVIWFNQSNWNVWGSFEDAGWSTLTGQTEIALYVQLKCGSYCLLLIRNTCKAFVGFV